MLLKMLDESDPVKAFELKAVNKFTRTQAVMKFSRYFALYCLPFLLCFAVSWICFNLEVVLLTLRVVCLVKIPEVWHFCSNQWFLFLLINVIVISLALMSGSRTSSNGNEDLYDEYVRRNEPARKYYASCPVFENKPANSQGRRNSVDRTGRPTFHKMRSLESMEMQQTQNSEATATATAAAAANSLIVIEVPSVESADMSAEELRRRSDEFIAKVNRRIGEESSAFYRDLAKRFAK